jgi:hypothetical protein
MSLTKLQKILEKDRITKADIRIAYPLLRVWEERLKLLRDSIKEVVKEKEEIALSESRKLVMETVSIESVSLKSIRESMPGEEGEIVVSALRQKGAVRKTYVERMVERCSA